MTDEKQPVQPVDGSPKKRVFWSIISDYNLKTALCELIDNALDQWRLDKKGPPLTIRLVMDVDRKVISVKDNTGGVKLDDLNVLIAREAAEMIRSWSLSGSSVSAPSAQRLLWQKTLKLELGMKIAKHTN
jgi:hypothetical protein